MSTGGLSKARLGPMHDIMAGDVGGVCISPRNEYTVSGGYAKTPKLVLHGGAAVYGTLLEVQAIGSLLGGLAIAQFGKKGHSSTLARRV